MSSPTVHGSCRNSSRPHQNRSRIKTGISAEQHHDDCKPGVQSRYMDHPDSNPRDGCSAQESAQPAGERQAINHGQQASEQVDQQAFPSLDLFRRGRSVHLVAHCIDTAAAARLGPAYRHSAHLPVQRLAQYRAATSRASTGRRVTQNEYRHQKRSCSAAP